MTDKALIEGVVSIAAAGQPQGGYLDGVRHGAERALGVLEKGAAARSPRRAIGTSDIIEVTQADREAAACFEVPGVFMGGLAYRQGNLDFTPVVQAFARHRLAAEQSRASTPAVGREAIARALWISLDNGDPDLWDGVGRGSDSAWRGYMNGKREKLLATADAILALHPPASDDAIVAKDAEIARLRAALVNDLTLFADIETRMRECWVGTGKLSEDGSALLWRSASKRRWGRIGIWIVASGAALHGGGFDTYRAIVPDFSQWQAPYVTASLDAAMTLADGFVLLHLSDIGADGLPLCKLGDPSTTPPGESTGIAARLPLAVTAAALRASAHLITDPKEAS